MIWDDKENQISDDTLTLCMKIKYEVEKKNQIL